MWGTGHIGYSSMCHFAERGVRIVGVDVDPEKVELINRGDNPIFAMDYWLGFTPKYLYESGVARATTQWEELIAKDVLVHLVCIPTERFGKPYFDILEEICRKLTTFRDLPTAAPPVVIIESTLAPNTADNVVIPIFEAAGMQVGRDVLIGCAPRRDWFGTPDKSLRTLPRIIGGTDGATTAVMKDVLGIVCENLLPAPDHHHAEVVKSIENAYRHMEIALANELALAYPGLDVRTVLQLVGTKWNVGTFHPSLGVGGYCIPLASLYVLEGATHPEYLTLLEATVSSSEAQPKRVAQYLVDRGDVKKVGILGLSYIGNVKVWSQSPTIEVVRVLKQSGIDVAVHDPHYSADEIKRIADAETFDFPRGLADFDTVI
ncbi:MAG: nucleotide sugar dehydrogenase, partial [Actinomycetota bacterium]|nr:nucleotide sugar dehydrogenase [Actinomycetota bacterium]